jgi:hypothetical protein
MELFETGGVSFQNKFEKLVHLVDFILRICHDARSHECKIRTMIFIDQPLSVQDTCLVVKAWNKNV